MKINDILFEFAPPGSGDSGDDGFSEETLKRLAAQWYNGDEDPRIERTLMAAGWEIGQDEGYDDEPGVFVVQSGDVNGNSYISWPAHELKQGVAEGYSLGKVLSLPELLDQIKHILAAKHPGIGWRMTMPAEDTFLFSAQNDYDVWSMLVVEPGGDDWVAVGHGMVDPDGKPTIFDRQQLPMTLASASEIADEAIQTYHDIDLSDYADDEDYNQGVAEDAEPQDREFALVKKLGRLGQRIVQNPRLWEKYTEAVDSNNLDWIISLIQEGTGADKTEVRNLDQIFGEIGGGLGRLVDFAWAVKEGTWEQDFMNPYRQHRSQGVAEGLNEFAPAGGGNTPRGPKTPGRDPWDNGDSGDDPYSRPEPEYYSRSIDFFGRFEADHFDEEVFDEKTGVFKGYWFDREAEDGKIQIAYFKFDDPRQAARDFDDSPGMGWYYEPVEEGIEGEIAGGAIGGLVGGAAGSTLGPIGGAIGSALGSSAGSAIGGRYQDGKPLKEKQQLDEIAPLLAIGARLFMAAAPKIAQVIGKTGRAGAQGAGQAAKAGAEIAAKNAGQIGLGAGVYEIGSSVADIAKDITAKVGQAVDEKTVVELATLAFKYAIPAGIVLAILYGGKKAIDSLFSNDEQKPGVAEGKKKSEPPEADYGPEYQDMVARVKKLAGLGPLKTVYDPAKRVYKNVPVAVQPAQQPKKEQR